MRTMDKSSKDCYEVARADLFSGSGLGVVSGG